LVRHFFADIKSHARGLCVKLIQKAKSQFSAYTANEYYIQVNPGLSKGQYNLAALAGFDLYGRCQESRSGGTFESDTEYFLVFNENPEIDLIVDGTFNGIILTAGQSY